MHVSEHGSKAKLASESKQVDHAEIASKKSEKNSQPGELDVAPVTDDVEQKPEEDEVKMIKTE